MIEVSPAQRAALERIARDVQKLRKQGWARSEVAKMRFGYGAGTYYTRPTIVALASRGFVVTHVDAPTARPSKVGFGRSANDRTIYGENRWFTLTPRTLSVLFPEAAE